VSSGPVEKAKRNIRETLSFTTFAPCSDGSQTADPMRA
jgi:hypothetical protein